MRKVLIGIGYIFLLILFLLIGAFVWSANKTSAQREMRAFSASAPRHDVGRALVVCYSLSGNTLEIAARIAAMTEGTLFEIETAIPYPAAPMLYFTAWRELKTGNFHELKKIVGDFSDYDIVFVGAPVWWFTVPGPMRSFLARADFGGRTVVPFCTQGGNAGEYFDRFRQEARNAELLQGKEFSHVAKTDTDTLDGEISAWLEEIARSRKQNDNDQPEPVNPASGVGDD